MGTHSRRPWLLLLALGGCADVGSLDSEGDAMSAEPPELGAALQFAVLAGRDLQSSGETHLTGSVSPGTSEQPEVDATDAGHFVADELRQRALGDAEDAAERARTGPCSLVLQDAELGTRLLGHGVICLRGHTRMTGDLVLDAQGNDLAVFVLRVEGPLEVAPGASVRMRNCAEPRSVFWSVAGDVTLGEGATVLGNVLADGDITLSPGAMLRGRAIAPHGSVVLDGASVSITGA